MLKLKDQTNDARDQIVWKWAKGAATGLADFKFPVTGTATYRLCLYDASANPQPRVEADVPPGGQCGTKPCWKQTGFTTDVYANRAGTPNGVTSLKLKAGTEGSARVTAKIAGLNLQTPALPLALPVTMQLVIRDDTSTECWQATYTNAILNDPAHFSATGP